MASERCSECWRPATFLRGEWFCSEACAQWAAGRPARLADELHMRSGKGTNHWAIYEVNGTILNSVARDHMRVRRDDE